MRNNRRLHVFWMPIKRNHRRWVQRGVLKLWSSKVSHQKGSLKGGTTWSNKFKKKKKYFFFAKCCIISQQIPYYIEKQPHDHIPFEGTSRGDIKKGRVKMRSSKCDSQRWSPKGFRKGGFNMSSKERWLPRGNHWKVAPWIFFFLIRIVYLYYNKSRDFTVEHLLYLNSTTSSPPLLNDHQKVASEGW